MSHQKQSVNLNQPKKNKRNKKRTLSMKRKLNLRQEVERTLVNILSGAQVNCNSTPLDRNALYSFQMNFLNNRYIHEIAIWKSRALSLEAENRILHTTIRAMQWAGGSRNVPMNVQSASTDTENSSSESDTNFGDPDKLETPKSASDDSENDEVDEEFINFLEKSARFRMERDAKKKNEHKSESNLTLGPPPLLEKTKRLEELKLLYGEDFLTVMGLETSIQLNYDNYVSKQKPSKWPDVSLTF